MHIFVISLKSSRFRRARMQDLLTKLHCPFAFYDAILGIDLPDNVLEAYHLHKSSKLTKPELGALLSHINLWKHMVTLDIKQALILEDDLHFSASFPQVLRHIHIPDNLIGIFRLETMLASVNVNKSLYQSINNIHIRQIFSNHAGAGAYIINKKTAGHLLSQTHLFIEAIDTELFDPTRSNLKMPIIYQCIPGVALQDKCLPPMARHPQLTSIINDNRQDKIEGLLVEDHPLKCYLKKIGRPFYLKIYSLCILAQHKNRVQVKFE